MATMYVKKCDLCGGQRSVSEEDYKFFDPKSGEEFIVNSIRLGQWDSKNHTYISIGAAYDVCPNCARRYVDLATSDGMNFKKCDNKKRYTQVQKPVNNVDKEQAEFAKSQEEQHDAD